MDDCAQSPNSTTHLSQAETERLLKTLEFQSATLRGRSEGGLRAMQGNGFRYGSLIAIVVFVIGAVAAMEWMVAQFPKPRPVSAPAAAPAANSKNEN